MSLRSLLLAGAVSVAVSSWSMPALAQDDDDEETFVVTGSRIARSDVNSENPVTIISGDDLRSTGQSNLGESLRSTLAAGSGGFNQSSILSGGGSSSIDLRNLGANRVLILINGRRVADFADGLANRAGDLSLIPTAMVERVEILRDGASTAYGADAVSGVVNVILKTEFEGLTFSTLAGISTHGDGEQVTVSATMGGNFERGNIVASLEYRFNDEVMQRDREFAFPAISFLGGGIYTNGSFFSPGGVVEQYDPLDDFTTTAGWCTQPAAFGGDEVTDIYPNCPSYLLASGGNQRSAPTRYDYSLQQNMFGGSQIFGAAFYGTYDINDSITAFMEFQANNRESNFRLDGNPGSFRVPSNNPYMLAEGFDPAQLWYLYIRPTTTVGPRQSNIDATILRTVAGFQGDDLFGRFSWEVSYLWTKMNASLLVDATFNPIRAARIMDPVACAADPSGLCAQALIAAGKGSSTATVSDDALDPLRPGNWSEAEIAYFRQRAMSTSVFETSNWFASISGEIVDLPAGPLAFAAGYEFREEQGFNKPDSVTEAGESISNQVFTTSGGYDVSEFFGELNIPILSGMQWAEELSVNLQGRWFDYSNFGDDTVWKVGINYQITPDIRWRLNQGTAFRAPTIVNLFGGGTASFDFYSDPCAAGDPLQTSNPNVVPNCQADGLNPFTYLQFAGQTNVLSGSNPNLEPETADTMSTGLILTPSFLPNLTATIDWWQISIQNLISRPTSDSVFDACYTGAQTLAHPNCARFTRNPATGQPTGLVNQLSNTVGGIRTDGLDWRVRYFWDQFGGTLTFDHAGTYVFENTFAPGQGGADDRGSIPQFKSNNTLSYSRNDWSVSWQTRIIGDMDDPRRDGVNAFSYDGPEEHVTHTLRGRYQYDNYSFLLGVSNLFDEEPPYVFGTGNNTDLFTYSAMGRYYFARITADF